MHHLPSVNLVKEFAEFKQKSNVLRKPEVPKEQGKRSKDDSLEKIDQLENLIVTKGKSRDQSTTTTTTTTVEDTTSSKFTESKVEEDGTSYKTSETTDGSEPETPKTLSLTSDSHQKRGPLDDLNQDDGTSILLETKHTRYCFIFRDVCCCCCWGRSLLHHCCCRSRLRPPPACLLSRELLPLL